MGIARRPVRVKDVISEFICGHDNGPCDCYELYASRKDNENDIPRDGQRRNRREGLAAIAAAMKNKTSGSDLS